jgi:hypothetical protein
MELYVRRLAHSILDSKYPVVWIQTPKAPCFGLSNGNRDILNPHAIFQGSPAATSAELRQPSIFACRMTLSQAISPCGRIGSASRFLLTRSPATSCPSMIFVLLPP